MHKPAPHKKLLQPVTSDIVVPNRNRDDDPRSSRPHGRHNDEQLERLLASFRVQQRGGLERGRPARGGGGCRVARRGRAPTRLMAPELKFVLPQFKIEVAGTSLSEIRESDATRRTGVDAVWAKVRENPQNKYWMEEETGVFGYCVRPCTSERRLPAVLRLVCR